MFGLSLNTVLFIFNTVVGAAIKYLGVKQEIVAKQHEQMLEMIRLQAGLVKEAREIDKNSPLSWARKWVVVVAVLSIVALPLWSQLFFDIPVVYVFAERIKGGIFSHARETMTYLEVTGFVILPYMVEMIISIVGLLFGYSILGKRK